MGCQSELMSTVALTNRLTCVDNGDYDNGCVCVCV